MTIKVDDLPSSIRIGAYDIQICYLSKDDDDMGSFDSSTETIWIQSEFKSNISAVDTLIHEILHACWDVSALPSSAVVEEQVVASITPVMTQVFRDNPAVVEWISRRLR